MTKPQPSLDDLYEPDIVDKIKAGMVELPCARHLYSLEIDVERDGPPGCPECGKLLTWGHCWLCGADFLVFGSGWDDVGGDCSASASGDLMCARCATDYADEEQEESYGEYGDWASS